MTHVPNPMGTDGFEFVEFAAPDPEALDALFRRLGFRLAAVRERVLVWCPRRHLCSTAASADGAAASRICNTRAPRACARPPV